MKNFTSILILSLLIALVISASVANAAAKYNFKYATYAPAENIFTKIAIEYADRVEKATSGTVKITVYPNAALCSGADQYKSVAMGMVDMTDIVSDYMVGEVEMLGLGCLPFGYDWKKAHLVGEEARDLISDRLTQDNIVYLFTYGTGGNSLFLKKAKDDKSAPVLKGQKVRASGVYPIEAAKAINMVPVQMGTGEVYMSVETGLVNASIISVLSWAANTLYDVLPLLYNVNITPSWFSPVINADAFNRLPKDLQEALIKTAKDFAPVATQMVEKKSAELIETCVKTKNCKVYTPTKTEIDSLKKAMMPVQEKAIKAADKDTKAMWEVLKKYQ